MAVNPKDKKMLQSMWEGAEENSGADLPDGTYQFEILSARFHMTDKNKPTFKTKIKVVGGEEDYRGKEFEINDNLETKENMGWFKRKLRRLNITVTDDIDDIIDGAVADEMEGLVFEGQVKTKNDFVNVYVNRLIGEGSSKKEDKDEEEEKPKAKSKDKEEEAEEGASSFEEGDQVAWGDGKSGEIVEILADEEKARVQLEDETIVRVSLSKLSKAEKKGKGKEKEETEEKDDEAITLPTPDEVDDMKAGKIREVLEALGFDEVDDLKDPRGVLHAFSALAEDQDAKIALSEVKPLADALDLSLDKGDNMKTQLKQLSKAVLKKLG